MNFFNAIWSVLGDPDKLDKNYQLLNTNRMSDAGLGVTPEIALSYQVYFSCIRNLGEDFGKLPHFLYRKTAEGRERAEDHPAYTLLHSRPNLETGAMNFRECILHHAASWGGGFAEIERDGGRPVALWLIHPSRVKIMRDESGEIIYWVESDDIGTEPVPIRAYNILHLHPLGPTGITGYGMSYLAANTIGLGMQAEKFAGRFMAHDAMPSVAIKSDKPIKPVAKDILRIGWKDEYGGADNSHKIVILDDGKTVERLSMPPAEAQLMETRTFQADQIRGWFRMDGMNSETYPNERQRIYYTQTVHPWCKRFEEECDYKLLTEEERAAGYYSEINMDGALRGDPMTRANTNRTYFMIGARSINEIRARENDNSIGPDGDKYYVPLNMRPVDAPIAEPNPNSNPTSGRPGKPVENENPDVEFDKDSDAVDAANLIPAIEAALDRVLAKEWRAVERAHKKCQSVSEFNEWLTNFYEDIRSYMVDQLDPEFMFILPPAAARDMAETEATEYVCNRTAVARQEYASGSILSLTSSWRVAGSADLALEIVRKITNGKR